MDDSHPLQLLSNLEDFRIPSLPPSFYYIPNFITASEESLLLSKIHSRSWHQLSHRRLQVYPAPLSPKNTLLTSTPLPRWLADPIVPRLHRLAVFHATPHAAPNHVLVNDYKRGEGIMPHEDGPAYAPVVATVSLGSAVVLDVYGKGAAEGTGTRTGTRWRVLLEGRSLLVTRGEAYTELLHGIEAVEGDAGVGEGVCNWEMVGERERWEGEQGGWVERGVRVSLTFRDVAKVSKLGAVLLGKR